MLALSKERWTLLRPLFLLLLVAGAAVVGGELFGRVWRSNILFVGLLTIQAWSFFNPSQGGRSRPVFKPAHQWLTSENVFDWALTVLLLAIYVIAVGENFRKGVPDVAPGLSILVAPLLFLTLQAHVVRLPHDEPRRFF